MTSAFSSTRGERLAAATSATIAGTWPASSTALANAFGSMPYCWALATMYSTSSCWLTCTCTFSATASSSSCALKALRASTSTSARCSSSSSRSSPSRWRCTSSATMPSGTGTSTVSSEALEQPLAGLQPLLDALDLRDLLAQVVAQLVEGVELAGELGEVVVGRRQLALLDRLHGHGDLGLLAGAVAAGERRGEGRRLAGLQAGERLVHALEHLAGADLVGDAADAVDLLAVDRGADVERDEVAVLRGALDARRGCRSARGGSSSRSSTSASRDLDVVDRDRDAVELGELELGAHVDLGGELELAALGRVGHLGDVDLGLAERPDVALLDGLRVEPRERVVDRLLDDGAAADALVDDPRRARGPCGSPGPSPAC